MTFEQNVQIMLVQWYQHLSDQNHHVTLNIRNGGENVQTAWSIYKNDKYLCANGPNLNFPSFNEGIPSNHANLCIWFHRFPHHAPIIELL